MKLCIDCNRRPVRERRELCYQCERSKPVNQINLARTVKYEARETQMEKR